LQVCTWFNSPETHCFPECLNLRAWYNCRKAFEGNQRHHPRKCKHPKTFCEGHPDKNIGREKRQEYFCTTSFPVPLCSIQRKKSGDTPLLALLCQVFLVAAAGIRHIPVGLK
jgi:hypothetical protein